MRLFEGTQWDVPPVCDRCAKLESECDCPPPSADPHLIPPEKQKLRLRVERRKRGKTVTVIKGVADDDFRTQLLTSLKNLVGSGGTIREGNLELQGDHCDLLHRELLKRGYIVKN